MALKPRATRPPAQEWWTTVPCPPGHDTTASFKTRAPVSFKRMLDGALFTDARARRAPLGARARPWDENLPMGNHFIEGGARRGMSRSTAVGCGARRPEPPLEASALGAPRNHRTKRI